MLSTPKRKLRVLGARRGWQGFLYTSESLSMSRAEVEVKFQTTAEVAGRQYAFGFPFLHDQFGSSKEEWKFH